MRVFTHEGEAAVGRLEQRLPARDGHPGMEIRQDDLPADPHGTGELGDRRSQVVAVPERERAHGQVELAVLDGERVEVSFEEAGVRDAVPGDLEHLGRAVDAGDLVPQLCESSAVSARPARGVQRPPDGNVLEQRPHDGLLDADERIPGTVVRGGPARVAGAGVELGDVAAQPVRRLLVRCPNCRRRELRLCGDGRKSRHRRGPRSAAPRRLAPPRSRRRLPGGDGTARGPRHRRGTPGVGRGASSLDGTGAAGGTRVRIRLRPTRREGGPT